MTETETEEIRKLLDKNTQESLGAASSLSLKYSVRDNRERAKEKEEENLRDQFALASLVIIDSDYTRGVYGKLRTPKLVAKAAYSISDALMEARKK